MPNDRPSLLEGTGPNIWDIHFSPGKIENQNNKNRSFRQGKTNTVCVGSLSAGRHLGLPVWDYTYCFASLLSGIPLLFREGCTGGFANIIQTKAIAITTTDI